MKKIQILNGFWIRIIAIITMVIDHLAILLVNFDLMSLESNTYYFMRLLGRLSFPLFAFGIVEGVLHSKNIKKYLMRLGIMAVGITLAIIIIEKAFGFILIFVDNIFLTLFLGALSISLIKKKNWISFFSIIPIGLSIFGNYYILAPYFVPQYGIYGVLMILFMYLGNIIAHIISKKQAAKANLNYSDYITTSYYQQNVNLLYAAAIVIVNVIFYVLVKFIPSLNETILMFIQDYSIISIIFMILYSGKRGYDSKWYRTFNYLFYPMHLVLLYVILYLLF
ncbi:MAG: hypothetical protein J1F31_02715 [Erysipelotrichales bacterium]|nr:hypothetical protein [Erysipelotrichales bacterium]